MEKITRFRDIPQFTSAGCYQVCYHITHLVGFIEDEIRDAGLELNPEFQRGMCGPKDSRLRGWNTIYVAGSQVIPFT